MKNNILQKLMLIAVLLTGSHAFAHDFEAKNSDGVTIYYNILSEDDKTVEVTYQGSSYNENSNEYTGNIVIPGTVTSDDITYNVISIEDRTFVDCTGLTSIQIPNTVQNIGLFAFSGCVNLSTINIPNY